MRELVTALAIGLSAALVFAYFMGYRIRLMVRTIVGQITFHESMSAELSAIIREAVVYSPEVSYFTRPANDGEGWYTIFVCKSPDAEKFFKSVKAQLSAKSVRPSDF